VQCTAQVRHVQAVSLFWVHDGAGTLFFSRPTNSSPRALSGVAEHRARVFRSPFQCFLPEPRRSRRRDRGIVTVIPIVEPRHAMPRRILHDEAPRPFEYAPGRRKTVAFWRDATFIMSPPVKAPTPRWSRDARASAGCCAVLGGLAPTPHRYYPAAEGPPSPQMRGRKRKKPRTKAGPGSGVKQGRTDKAALIGGRPRRVGSIVMLPCPAQKLCGNRSAARQGRILGERRGGVEVPDGRPRRRSRSSASQTRLAPSLKWA
jgi:hypothetical protein